MCTHKQKHTRSHTNTHTHTPPHHYIPLHKHMHTHARTHRVYDRHMRAYARAQAMSASRVGSSRSCSATCARSTPSGSWPRAATTSRWRPTTAAAASCTSSGPRCSTPSRWAQGVQSLLLRSNTKQGFARCARMCLCCVRACVHRGREGRDVAGPLPAMVSVAQGRAGGRCSTASRPALVPIQGTDVRRGGGARRVAPATLHLLSRWVSSPTQ